MTDVQSEKGSIAISSFWSAGPTLRIDSLSASEAHSIARPDLTFVIAIIAEGVTPAFSVKSFLIVTGDSLDH